ncbi:MAG TPA: hypothetical protein VIL48_10540 [Acidimicrobiales bacterium]
MQVTKVLSALAVSDLDRAKPWYQAFFGRPPDAEPMPGLAEWHTPGGAVQLVADGQRAGGSLVTLEVPDARGALAEVAARGGPAVEVDDVSSDRVVFATVVDPDGNGITLVELRQGRRLRRRRFLTGFGWHLELLPPPVRHASFLLDERPRHATCRRLHRRGGGASAHVSPMPASQGAPSHR